ncbi:hypothetical protein AGDE_15124 [Angomonas deanei]|uniref:Uncharacterized protein n=1 Tax=Angomonas deanei TaxID=59799 RepID=A0A7G2CID8_9TRYP|nr:hypothetical protein AGDE_15124 [Angomonas deanei]CAD2219620.1 hypothetical protein, conserved [Angomonas deanei]|eukprot:EPY19660.1 hypothetical protein AGDE_15124 [Angomonas deanei]
MLKKVLSFSIVSKYPSSQSHSPQEVFGTDVKLVQGKFTKNNPVVPIRTSQRGSRYKDENVLTGTDALEDNEPSALENSDVEEDYSGFLKITRDELAEITQHDEVLEMFFELTNSLLPEYVQKQIRVLPPESVLEFLVHKSSTAAPCGPDDLTLEPFEEALLTPQRGAKHT